jgi:hypothetical protein
VVKIGQLGGNRVDRQGVYGKIPPFEIFRQGSHKTDFLWSSHIKIFPILTESCYFKMMPLIQHRYRAMFDASRNHCWEKRDYLLRHRVCCEIEIGILTTKKEIPYGSTYNEEGITGFGELSGEFSNDGRDWEFKHGFMLLIDAYYCQYRLNITAEMSIFSNMRENLGLGKPASTIPTRAGDP